MDCVQAPNRRVNTEALDFHFLLFLIEPFSDLFNKASHIIRKRRRRMIIISWCVSSSVCNKAKWWRRGKTESSFSRIIFYFALGEYRIDLILFEHCNIFSLSSSRIREISIEKSLFVNSRTKSSKRELFFFKSIYLRLLMSLLWRWKYFVVKFNLIRNFHLK